MDEQADDNGDDGNSEDDEGDNPNMSFPAGLGRLEGDLFVWLRGSTVHVVLGTTVVWRLGVRGGCGSWRLVPVPPYLAVVLLEKGVVVTGLKQSNVFVTRAPV